MIKIVVAQYSKYLVIMLGVMLVGFGLVTMIHPEIMNRYGLNLGDAHAKSTVMAVIGGSEIGLGFFVLFGHKIGVKISARIAMLLLIFMGILVARLLSVVLYYPELPNVFFREVIAEISISVLLLIGLLTERRQTF